MVNEIINGIAIKLNSVFGSDYKIYKESIEQGLTEPCFSIVLLQAVQEARLPNRYFRSLPFDVHYFPKSTTNAKNEMYEVGEQLLMALETITVKDNGADIICRGTRMRYEIVDGVLHFFVNYDFFVNKEQVKLNTMENLSINPNVEA